MNARKDILQSLFFRSKEGGLKETLHPTSVERKIVPENSLFPIFFAEKV